MPDILVRDVPHDVLAALKEQAANNRRSLQQELILVLEAAVGRGGHAVNRAAQIRERLAGYGRSYSDSTEQIREDRGR